MGKNIKGQERNGGRGKMNIWVGEGEKWAYGLGNGVASVPRWEQNGEVGRHTQFP